MKNVLVIGRGRMGREIEAVLQTSDSLSLAASIEFAPDKDVIPDCDVLIDFSHPNNIASVIAKAREALIPVIIGTTGLGDAHNRLIEQAAREVAIVKSSNFSTGVAIMERLAKEMRAVIDMFDVEIVETHHRAKLDAPSGTAKTLVEALDPEHSRERVYGRAGEGKRGREIGVHSIRGGTVAGEHSILFLGEDETIEIKHSAASRRIFARGAILAAKFALEAAPGLYSMSDVLWGDKK